MLGGVVGSGRMRVSGHEATMQKEGTSWKALGCGGLQVERGGSVELELELEAKGQRTKDRLAAERSAGQSTAGLDAASSSGSSSSSGTRPQQRASQREKRGFRPSQRKLG